HRRILVSEHLPVLRVRNLVLVMAKGVHGRSRCNTSYGRAPRGICRGLFLLSGYLFRRQRLHPRDALLDLAKFRTVAAITVLKGESRDLFRYCLGTIAGIGMVAEELRPARSSFSLQLGEKFRHRMGIEARVIHDVSPEQISFRFSLT